MDPPYLTTPTTSGVDPPRITINLFVSLSMTADSDCYTNRLYKFQRGPKK